MCISNQLRFWLMEYFICRICSPEFGEKCAPNWFGWRIYLMKVLRSKCTSSKNYDTWWFALSSPEKWVDKEPQIDFVLNDQFNSKKIGTAHLMLDETGWYHRIMDSNKYHNHGVEIVSVHIQQKHMNPSYHIYFGRKTQGTYLIEIDKT
jgi:hypothetical protein